jgi:Cys-tRNA(Pro)/Cys-tRNA(Cys) deacylase
LERALVQRELEEGNMIQKTNAMRQLDQAGVQYRVESYEIEGPDQLADQAAAALGVAPERVFKTLVAVGDRTGTLLVLIPAGTEVDLRLLARATGDKKVELAAQREVLGLTGYERGAVTPLAMARNYPVWIDETVELWDEVGISAGAHGFELLLAPQDLMRVSGAQKADIARSR